MVKNKDSGSQKNQELRTELFHSSILGKLNGHDLDALMNIIDPYIEKYCQKELQKIDAILLQCTALVGYSKSAMHLEDCQKSEIRRWAEGIIDLALKAQSTINNRFSNEDLPR